MPTSLTKSLLLLSIFLIPLGLARAEDKPTVVILRFGPLTTFDTTEGAILDVLESYGFISADENAFLHTRQNLEGENINIFWGSANFDLPTANLMMRQALDREPDVLVTLTTSVTQLAISNTIDMDDPPAVLFTSVYNPYEAGIVESTCIKPEHVTGSVSIGPYEDILAIMVAEQPGIKTIGTIFNSGESAGVAGAKIIQDIGEELGLTVLSTAVTSLPEVNLAALALLDSGIDAFVMPIDLRTGAAGLPIIVNHANEYNVPVYHPILFAVYYGATMSAGFYHYYAQGENVGVMLAAYLNGDIDIAATGINEQGGSAIGVNVESAKRQGIDVSQALIDQADVVVSGDNPRISERVKAELTTRGVVAPLTQRQAMDKLFLAKLACTPEMIAAQRAALNAEEGAASGA